MENYLLLILTNQICNIYSLYVVVVDLNVLKMKLKIKYSNTQKFIINIDDATIGSVKEAIRKFVNDTYNCSVREPFYLSINGKTALEGSDEDPVQSVGIVPGDLISVIYDMPQGQPCESSSHNIGAAQPKSDCSMPWENMDKQSLGTNTISCSAQKEENRQLTSVPRSSEDHTQTSNQVQSKQGQIPPRVYELFDEARPPGPSEAMNLLIHLAMLEGGFQTVDSPNNLPNNWKELAVTIKYQHMRYASFTCIVVMVTMGNVKKILASFPQQELELSVSLKIEQYVISGHSPVQYQHLKCLGTLDLMLKNKLLYPLHVAAHQTLGVPAPWQLHGLPHEILLKIAYSLDVCSIAHLASTCSSLRPIMDSRNLWKKLCIRDFPHEREPIDGDWKRIYKTKYVQKQEAGNEFVFGDSFFPYDPLQGMMPRNPMPGGPPYPGLPHPWGDPVPVPNPLPNPFHDPDSPYFSGDVPPGPGMPNPLGPIGPLGPRQPRNPLQPNHPLMPKYPGRGPRFDYF